MEYGKLSLITTGQTGFAVYLGSILRTSLRKFLPKQKPLAIAERNSVDLPTYLSTCSSASVSDAYAKWINAVPFAWSDPAHTLGGVRESRNGLLQHASFPTGKVGIVGAGISGLYAGLLLKERNIPFHLFEGRKDRVGGRIYTCREGFGSGENDYFEAGAMRLPCIPSHDPVFDLINYVNKQLTPRKSDEQLELMDYCYRCEDGNLVYVNGKMQKDGRLMTLEYADNHPNELGYVGLKPEDAARTAQSHMEDVMTPLLKEFKEDRDKFFKKYDNMSLRYYLANCTEPKWYHAKINYVETMTSGTNAFAYGLIDSVIEHEDFHSHESGGWKTIRNGMSRLPEACAQLIGRENITNGATVYKIEEEGDKVVVTYSTDGSVPSNNPKVEVFDKLLITIPNPVLRMIERPQWSSEKEEAIRACNTQPCFKLGLQFKTRFWEKGERPAYGGQSTTDTPSRWIVYPSYGFNDPGKGILLTYCWSTDALNLLPASDEQMKDRALRDIQKLYPDENIDELFTGKYKSVNWTSEWSTGVADFLPGQIRHLLPILRKNERNIYFAGEHISIRHGWIVGALDSAGYSCKQMFPNVDFCYPK